MFLNQVSRTHTDFRDTLLVNLHSMDQKRNVSELHDGLDPEELSNNSDANGFWAAVTG